MPYLHLDDVDLYYETHGQGRPFLFNAATSTWGEVWKFYQVDEFSRDHQVIIFDQRGTGRSRTEATNFSTKRLADDAAALLRHLDVRDAIVLGHSNGGRVAQALALDEPDLVGKLILASSGGGALPGSPKGVPISICVGLAEKGYERMLLENASKTGFTEAFRAEHPDEVERFMKVRLGDLPPLRAYLGHVVGRQDYDLGDRLKSMQIPTLVMIGDDEDHDLQGGVTHMAYAKRLANEIPNARLVVLKGQGHYYYFSAPDLMNGFIREFLSE